MFPDETTSVSTSVSNSSETKTQKDHSILGYAIQPLASIHLPIPQSKSTSTRNGTSTQDVLSRIYESYSFQFPNAQVLRERERHAQAKMEANANQGNRSAGLFARLFGPDASSDQTTAVPIDGAMNEAGPSSIDGSDEKENVNINSMNESEQSQDINKAFPLLGTDRFDGNVVPPEAHQCARFYLSSIKSKATATSSSRNDSLGAFKVCQSDLKAQKSMWVIVDFGLLVEIPLDCQNEDFNIDQNANAALQIQTNDREALLEAQELYAQSPTPLVPSVDLVRCTQLSTNCIAISWGMQDGIIVIYRKVQLKDGKVEWHSVAMVTPLQKVVEDAGRKCTLAKIVGESAVKSRSIYESGTLRATELLALHLGSSQSGHKTLLAVSRLGGYLEFVVIPTEVCQGPIITSNNKKRVRGQGHYAASMPNISGDKNLRHCWLPTAEAHADITAMAALRTHVGDDSGWDETLHPNAPPAAYVICTSGVSSAPNGVDKDSTNAANDNDNDNDSCQETLALWRLTVLQQSIDENDIFIHAGLLDKLQMRNQGPNVAAFVSKSTSSNWLDRCNPSSSLSASIVTTYSPISSIRIVSSPTANVYLVATLDFNGGAEIINCSDVIRNATHEVGFVKNGMNSINQSDKIRKVNAQLCQDSGSMVELSWWQSDNSLHLVGISSKGSIIVRKALTSDSYMTALTFPVVGLTPIPASKACFIINNNAEPQNAIHLFGHTTKTLMFCLWSIGNLSPQYYLQSLISKGRFQEASETMELYNLNFEDGSIMDKCFIRLWETYRDAEALKKVSNIQYVVQESLSLENLIASTPSFDIVDLHGILSDALQRMLASNSDDITFDRDTQSKIQDQFSRLGTFILIGRLIGASNASPKRFYQRFFRSNISELAISFATHGDIRGVLLFVLRHWNELRSPAILRNIIHHLPLSTPIDAYEFLLPSYERFDCLEKWEALVEHAENNLSIDIFLGESDKSLFYNALSRCEMFADEQESVMDWYLNRAKEMISGFGFLDNAVLLLNKALERGGDGNSAADDTTILDVLSLRASAYHIHCIVELGVHLDSNLVDRIQSMTIEEFESLGVLGAIRLILSGCRDSSDTIFRYKELLCPMLCDNGEGTDFIIRCWPDLATDEPSFTVDRRKELELGTVLFCLENIQEAVDLDHRQCDRGRHSSLIALSLCEAVVTSSSIDVPTHDRIIDDELFLMQFVLDTAKIIGNSLTSAHVEKLWHLYECIPTCPDQFEPHNDGFHILSRSVDCLYRSLTGLSIALKWQQEEPVEDFSLKKILHAHEAYITNTGDIELHSSELIALGTTLIVVMIQGFSSASASCIESHQDTLFCRFVSDITDVNEHCCYGLLAKSTTFNNSLIDTLLDLHSFRMLRRFLLCDLITAEALSTAVFNFITKLAAEYRGDKNSKLIQIISDFKADFSVVSPDCCSGVDSLNCFIAATTFMRDSLGFSRESIPSFDAFLSSSPMSLVDLTLKTNPRCVYLECPSWEDPMFASEAMIKMSEQFIEDIDSVGVGVSPVPGNHILHLANLVGLGDPRSQFFVKNRIVESALNKNQHGVALALCMTMLHAVISGEKSGHRIDTLAGETLMKSIAAAVSHRSLINDAISATICKLCLGWYKADDYGNDAVESLNCVMHTYSLLEVKLSKMKPFDKTKRCDLSRTMHGILSTIHAIDETFRTPEESCEHITANHILPWCIKTLFDSSISKNYHAVHVLELAVSFLTEANTSNDALRSMSKCISEIENRSPFDVRDNAFKADGAIVDRLIYRGYTRDGARRAALMSNNESASAALLWAVAHAGDTNFDEPMAVLRRENESANNFVLNEGAIRVATIILARAIAYLGKKDNQVSTGDSSIPGPVKVQKTAERSPITLTETGQNKPQIVDVSKGSSIKDDYNCVPEKSHSHHRPKARVIVVPTKTKVDISQPEKKKLVEGGRQLLMSQRGHLRRNQRSKLASEGRRILEEAKGKGRSINSCRSIESADSGISSFTWNTFSSNNEREICILDSPQDEESQSGEEMRLRIEAEIEATRLQSKMQVILRSQAEEEAARLQTQEEKRLRLKHYQEEERLCIEAEEAESARMQQQMQAKERLCIEAEAAEAARMHQQEEVRCLRIEAETTEAARLQHQYEEEEERLRVEAEATRSKQEEEERLRIDAQEAEAARFLHKLEEERLRIEGEEAEYTRLQEQEEERHRIKAEEAEASRLQEQEKEEERLRIEAEEAETTKLQEQEEEERLRIEFGTAEARLKHQQEEEEERLRIEAGEAEAARLKEEEEEERLRIEAEEAEAARFLQQQEEERLHIEAERAESTRLQEQEEKEECLRIEAEEAEATRLQEQEEERLRIEAEEAKAARLKHQQEEEEERLRIEAEAKSSRLKQEQEERLRIEAEAVEAEAARLLQQEEEERLRIEAEDAEAARQQQLQKEERLRIEAEEAESARGHHQEQEEERLRIEAEQEEEYLRIESEEEEATNLKSEEEERIRIEVEASEEKSARLQQHQEEDRLRTEAVEADAATLQQEVARRVCDEAAAIEVSDLKNDDSMSLDDFIDDDGWGFDPECSHELNEDVNTSEPSPTGTVLRSGKVLGLSIETVQVAGKVLKSDSVLHTTKHQDESRESQGNGFNGEWSFEDDTKDSEAGEGEDDGWGFDF